MANISNEVNVHDGAAVTNWISQINVGNTVYDIATHHNITFVEGQGGARTTWNGLSDIEVVIPTIKDIVQTPIEFAGTVGADGVIVWNDTHKDGPKTGYLVFFTADCDKFSEAEIACEAGDMAIYDGAKWNVVSGENQVQLVGSTDADNRLTIAVGASKDVLTVEGKTLALTLDYADLNGHLNVTPGAVEDVVIDTITVAGKHIDVKEGEKDVRTIGTDKTIKDLKATKLSDGTVNLTGATGLVNSITPAVYTQGTLPTITTNQERTFDVSGGAVEKIGGEDFIATVSNSAVTFVTSDGTGNYLEAMTNITEKVGAAFVNGAHITKESETADITVEGYIKPTDGVNAKFVTGLEGNITKVITSATEGDIVFGAGSDVVTGLGEEKSDKSGDVLTDVTVTANNDTSVLNEATVTDHVLSFGKTNVTSSVQTTYKSKSFNKGAYTYTKPEYTETAFTMGGFEQVADVKYTFDKGNETKYERVTEKWGLNTPALSTTKGAYKFSDSGMKAAVPAGSYVASATTGTLPTYTPMQFGTTDITGSVNTALDYTDVTIHTLADGITTIDLPGAYSLVEGDAGVEVGVAGDITVGGTVNLEGYVTKVEIK